MVGQQGSDVTPSLFSNVILTATPHVPDFLETSERCLVAAKELVKSLPNIQDLEHQTRVIDALGGIVHTIDHILAPLDPSDTFPPLACYLLLCKSFALQSRCILLRDPDDFRCAVYILEVLPQLCDPTDRDFSRTISGSLDAFLTQAARCFFDNRRASDFRLTQLLESSGISFDFVARAEFIVERAKNTSHIPAKVRGCCPQSPAIQDLDWVIATVDNVTERCDPSDQDLIPIARLCFIQVIALQARFRLLGETTDLDRSVAVSAITSHFCISASDLSRHALHTFAFDTHEYYHCGNPGRLDAIIAIGEELSGCTYQSEARLLVLEELATLLLRRCSTQGNIADGQRVLQLCADTIPFVTEEDRPDWLAIRADALHHLSQLGLQFGDLDQSLEYLDEGLEFVSSEEAESQQLKALFLWTQLKNVAVSGNEQAAVKTLHKIQTRNYAHYEPALHMFSEHSEDDILHIIEALKQMCILRSQAETFKPFAIILVIALWQRYRLSEDPRYLREALSLRSQLGPPGRYGLDFQLYAIASSDDFDAVERRSEFVRVLTTSSRGLSYQFPVPRVLGRMSKLGQRDAVGWWSKKVLDSVLSVTWKCHIGNDFERSRKFKFAYERNGDDTSFHIALREFLLQLSTSKGESHQCCKALRDLGSLYSSRYDRYNVTSDLQHAVEWYQRGVVTLPEDAQTQDAWLLRTAWANRLFGLHEATNSVEYSSLLLAHNYFRQAAASTHNTPDNRLTSLSRWMAHFPKLDVEDTMKHVPEVCELTLSLLEEQSWAASSLRWSMNSRYGKKELSKMITRFAMMPGINQGDVSKAIELIEASQALVWGNLHRLRAPLGDLEAVSPPLASRFQQLSRIIQIRMDLLDGSPEDAGPSPLGTNNWQLNQNMNQVIDEIRTLPDFEGFLRRRSFKEDELREVAKDGPVVLLLNTSRLSRALILQQDRHSLIDLPVTDDALRGFHWSLGNNVNYPSQDEANPISLQVENEEPNLQDLLELLWRRIVEPVLTEILGHQINGKGGYEKWEVPILDDRQRIWWCCQGEFSFLPIHAAGLYRRDPSICLSDFFVSSYTPTLTALLDARARSIPPDVKVLVAAQPNPGRGWGQLVQVKEELMEIMKATPPAHLIHLGDTNQPDFEGRFTSVDNILKMLPEASVFHLAGHGIQDMMDPLSSGFILADGNKLTIEELMRCQLPNAHTAILNACHTASNDADQPHEAINISSAFLFLGFSNVLATKWAMKDFDGPVIAKAVYQALFNINERPRSTKVLVDRQKLIDTVTEAISFDEHCLTLEPSLHVRAANGIACRPSVAKAIDQALFYTTPQSGSTNSLVDSTDTANTDVATCNEERHPLLTSFSLAKVIDGVVRYLRLEAKVPAKRWATFVHVGI